MDEQPSRRQVLLGSGTALSAALAGCPGDSDSPTPEPTPTETATPPPETVSTPPPTTTTPCPDGPLEPESEPGSFRLTHARRTEGRATLDETAAVFEERYDHDVAPYHFPGSFTAHLASVFPGGEGPLLFQWPHDIAGSYWARDYLVDRSDELRVDPCRYLDAAWAAANFEGRTVGLPFAGETVALAYNKAIVDEPPDTLAEMQTVMEASHDPEGGQYGFTMPLNPYYVTWLAQAYESVVYDGQTDTLGVASDGVERGLRILLEDLGPYMPDKPANDPQTEPFLDGNAAFTVDGSWQLSHWRAADVEVGVTTLPALPDGGTPRPYTGITLLYFGRRPNAYPENATAAREFAEWYTTSEERLLALTRETGAVPVLADLTGDQRLPPGVRAFSEQLRTGYPMPADRRMNHVWGPFGDAVVTAYTSEDPDLPALLSAAEDEIRQRWAEQ